MISYGLLMYKVKNQQLFVFIAHPGGPFFKNKQDGYWTIPKGEPSENEEPLNTAKREFFEETGINAEPPFIDLGEIKQKGGKKVQAWAFEKDIEVKSITSNNFTIEWPPKSGKRQSFPEIDQAAFFILKEAERKINPAQLELLKKLEKKLFDHGYLSMG